MGRHLIKESPEKDFYIEWSTIVEAPVYAGTRDEIRQLLIDEVHDERTRTWQHKPEYVDKVPGTCWCPSKT